MYQPQRNYLKIMCCMRIPGLPRPPPPRLTKPDLLFKLQEETCAHYS